MSPATPMIMPIHMPKPISPSAGPRMFQRLLESDYEQQFNSVIRKRSAHAVRRLTPEKREERKCFATLDEELNWRTERVFASRFSTQEESKTRNDGCHPSS